MAALRRVIWASTKISYIPQCTAERRKFSSLVSEGELRFPSLLPRNSFPVRKDPKERDVHWVFLGCPGVGKGTYASRLSQLLGVPHIATGDLVREELNSSGPLADQVRLNRLNSLMGVFEDQFFVSLLEF